MGSDLYMNHGSHSYEGPLPTSKLLEELRNRFVNVDDCDHCNNTGYIQTGFELTSGSEPCRVCGRGCSFVEILTLLEQGKAPARLFWKVRLAVEKTNVSMTATYSYIQAVTAQEAKATAIAAAAQEFNIPESDWVVESTTKEA